MELFYEGKSIRTLPLFSKAAPGSLLDSDDRRSMWEAMEQERSREERRRHRVAQRRKRIAQERNEVQSPQVYDVVFGTAPHGSEAA